MRQALINRTMGAQEGNKTGRSHGRKGVRSTPTVNGDSDKVAETFPESSTVAMSLPQQSIC